MVSRQSIYPQRRGIITFCDLLRPTAAARAAAAAAAEAAAATWLIELLLPAMGISEGDEQMLSLGLSLPVAGCGLSAQGEASRDTDSESSSLITVPAKKEKMCVVGSFI